MWKEAVREVKEESDDGNQQAGEENFWKKRPRQQLKNILEISQWVEYREFRQQKLLWPGHPKINYMLIFGEEMETANVDNSFKNLHVNKKAGVAWALTESCHGIKQRSECVCEETWAYLDVDRRRKW